MIVLYKKASVSFNETWNLQDPELVEMLEKGEVATPNITSDTITMDAQHLELIAEVYMTTTKHTNKPKNFTRIDRLLSPPPLKLCCYILSFMRRI